VEGLAPWQRHLEPWQYDLVSRAVATKTHRDSAFELSWACRRPEPPRSPSLWPVLVCDGSVQKDQGTFGWVLALSSGVVLSTGQGPAYGHAITSYRAEAYGMLSGILYVNSILQFYQPRQDALTSAATIRNMRIVCDNEGLITAIKTLLRRKRNEFVNETIGPEWDILQAIDRAIREFGTVAMIHVKGHQDEGNTNRRLPLLARLNVQADKLATSFQRCTNHGDDEVLEGIMPNSMPLLHTSRLLRVWPTPSPSPERFETLYAPSMVHVVSASMYNGR
jgi:ribonuclease HI